MFLVDTAPGYRLGVDLGGTKVELVVLGPDGAVCYQRREPTAARSYPALLAQLTALVAQVDATLGQRLPVGVGMPGSLSPSTGLVRNANTVCLNGQPFLDDLQRVLARPVRLANDANCFALSEAVDGAGQGRRLVFGVILGTGVGGGLVWDGVPWIGANAIAGEWGHNPLPRSADEADPGPACYCGRRGCVETYLSGPGFAADFVAHGGPPWDSHQIVAAAEQGDARAQAAMQLYVTRLARALAQVINILDPDVVVLGGGMSNIAGLPEAVMTLLPEAVFSDAVRTPVRRHHHGDASGVRGAAWLWGAP